MKNKISQILAFIKATASILYSIGQPTCETTLPLKKSKLKAVSYLQFNKDQEI